MPENPLAQARFDHVGQAGELVFAVGNSKFAVSVDETLERAILEAKQIKAESLVLSQPRTAATLPISQIQALIRAGADPAKVAERYGLSEALVRRFSTAVETEKQYAIEQFLTVPAPKESRVRTVSELIERTLAAAQIGMESILWKATRRGLEPWKISAQFQSAGRFVRAEWSWNMHDNAVVCLNSAAKKLLGEQNLSDEATHSTSRTSHSVDDGFSLALNIPGDSVRSARIERAVSAWGKSTGDSDTRANPNGIHASEHNRQTENIDNAESEQPFDVRHATNNNSRRVAEEKNIAARGSTNPSSSTAISVTETTGNMPYTYPDPRQTAEVNRSERSITEQQQSQQSIDSFTALSQLAEESTPDNETDNHRSSPQTHQPNTHQPNTESRSAVVSPKNPSPSDTVESRGTQQHEDEADTNKPAKRKSGRSAVPSWDEILFGD